MGKEAARNIGGLLFKLKELVDKSLTGTKPFYISGTDLHTVNGYAIKALTDVEFSALVVDVANNSSTDISSEQMMAGDVWYVPVKSIKLLSGSVFVYLHHKDNS